MPKTHDDLLLEIGTELELTTQQGDFFNVLDRIMANPRHEVITWVIRALDHDNESPIVVGDRVEVSIDIPVETVLAGREVDPNEVVGLFTTDAGESRRIKLAKSPGGIDVFTLTQVYVYDEGLKARHTAMVKTHPNVEGQILLHARLM